jgi:tRNA nucleotidyltransferase/poly(A) polymerase
LNQALRKLDPEKQRWFATEVVKHLRANDFEAYWAGGCVRDQLVGRQPKDYDVATSARPDEIQHVFGKRRTLAIGASFGVITVLGPPHAGQVEVATFRQDIGYSDGRRPDEVRFASAEVDAQRRDFTINGMFFDPVAERVIDFVDGQQDLKHRLIRAIGDPRQRFAEDKLRMLRAVRFAASFEFALEEQTAEAIQEMAPQITVVSAERIAAEMRAMLEGPSRESAVELLRRMGLLEQILPEAKQAATEPAEGQQRLALLNALERPTLPQALAVLLGWPHGQEHAATVSKRWRLSNAEAARTSWLLKHGTALNGAPTKPWSKLQPVLAHLGADELLALNRAAARLGRADPADVEFARQKLALPAEQLDPAPLISGDDLIQLQIPKGKLYSVLLQEARDAQLDGLLHSGEDAQRFVMRRWAELREVGRR